MERLQKLLAQAGVASRRHAEEMILAGRIRVNGSVVTELGTQVDPERDTILADNQLVTVEAKAYYLLNKPRGYISDRDETAQLKTALDLVPDGLRMFAAGRLDLTSEGLLLITNDGELANRLTHPRYEHEKEYLALVHNMPDDGDLERLERGILYEGEWLRADRAELAGRHQQFGEAGRDEAWIRLVLHEGKKRQIRHMCAAVGHPVKRLIRVRIGPLSLGKLKPGEFRKLTADEVAQLQSQSRRAEPRPRRRSAPPRENPKPRSGRTNSTRRESPIGQARKTAPRPARPLGRAPRPETHPARGAKPGVQRIRPRSRAKRKG